jgi:phytoene synthase
VSTARAAAGTRRPHFAYHQSVAGPVTPRSDPADAAGFAAARAMCRREAKAHYFESNFLPRAKRDAACALFAFCHMVREAVGAGAESLNGAHGLRHYPVAAACSSCEPTGSADGRIGMLRERLDEVYDGRLALPAPASRSQEQHALHAFALTVRRYGIPREHFLDLAQGCRADQAVSRYATWRALDRHCYGVAGVVGLILAGALGVTSSGAAEHAVKTGVTIELTRILCEIRRDRDRDRIYLPLEDLARFRYSERDLAASVVNDNFRELMRFQVGRARGFFREAGEGLCWLADDGSRFAVAAVAASHTALLDAIERERYDVFTRRPTLSATQKFRRFPLAWRLARRRARL